MEQRPDRNGRENGRLFDSSAAVALCETQTATAIGRLTEIEAMEKAMTWPQRFAAIVKRWQKVEKAARATNIPLARWQEFLAGSEPTLDELVQLMVASDVDGNWLLLGTGHPVRGRTEMERLVAWQRAVHEVEPYATPAERLSHVRTLAAHEKAVALETEPKPLP